MSDEVAPPFEAIYGIDDVAQAHRGRYSSALRLAAAAVDAMLTWMRRYGRAEPDAGARR